RRSRWACSGTPNGSSPNGGWAATRSHGPFSPPSAMRPGSTPGGTFSDFVSLFVHSRGAAWRNFMVSKIVPRDEAIGVPPAFVSIPDAAAETIGVEGHRGQRLRLYRLRASRAGAPVVLFGHACGFAAGAYLPWLTPLCDFAEVFAYDARGHGGSESR